MTEVTYYEATMSPAAREQFTDYVRGALAEPVHAARYATHMLADAEIYDPNQNGGQVHFEIPGRDTTDGNPLPFSWSTSEWDWHKIDDSGSRI